MNRAIAPSLATLTAITLLSGCSLLGGASVQEFSVGQCINDPIVAEDAEQEVGELPVVDCSEPHTGEVFFVEVLTDAEYPADAATRGDEICYNAFEPFVGISYEESALYVTSLYPTTTSWDAGDRQIVCLIIDADGAQMTGSAKGTAQ